MHPSESHARACYAHARLLGGTKLSDLSLSSLISNATFVICEDCRNLHRKNLVYQMSEESTGLLGFSGYQKNESTG
jgi:hypothetical protein